MPSSHTCWLSGVGLPAPLGLCRLQFTFPVVSAGRGVGSAEAVTPEQGWVKGRHRHVEVEAVTLGTGQTPPDGTSSVLRPSAGSTRWLLGSGAAGCWC